MKLSYQQKSALAATFIFLIWELNLVFPEQKKYMTLASIFVLLFTLIEIQRTNLSLNKKTLLEAVSKLNSLKFWKKNINYLILPLFLTVSTAAFVKLTYSFALQQITILTSLFSLYLIILHTGKSYARNFKKNIQTIRIFTLTKFYIAFISFVSVYGLLLNDRLTFFVACLYSFSFAIIFFYQAFKEKDFHELIYKLISIGILTVFATYLSFTAEVPLLAGGIIISTSYYLGWGLLQDDTKEKDRLEYIVITILILTIILVNLPGKIL